MPRPVPSLLGRVVVKRLQTSSIGPVMMSVAGSALLFGIGTEALVCTENLIPLRGRANSRKLIG